MYMLPGDRAGTPVVETCGLNGHQFALAQFINDDVRALLPEDGVLIQKKYLAELKKWLTADEIELAISDKRLFFRTGDQTETFSLPLSYYQYPNFRNFLAKLGEPDVSSLSVSRQEMEQALERLLIFNTDSNRCAYFQITPGELTLFSQGQEMGSATESMECTFSGELDKIAFPTKNLIDILGHLESSEVQFILTGTEAPCGITGKEDQDYQVILMPMMIQDETYYTEEDA